MASYIEKLEEKILGALGADVSASTSRSQAAQDALDAVRGIQSKVLSFSFQNTTNGTTPSPLYEGGAAQGAIVPFNARLDSAHMAVLTGALAASQTNYTTFALTYTPPAGTGSYTIASFSNTTSAGTALVAAEMTKVGTANLLTKGGLLGMIITKTGTGNTSGVGMASVVLSRRNAS